MLETQPRLNVAGQAGNSVNHHAGRLLAPIAQRMWPFPDIAKIKLSGQIMTNDCEAINPLLSNGVRNAIAIIAPAEVIASAGLKDKS